MPVGWDVRRVAEIISTFPDGREERGSGYRITEARVLTCWHAVKDAIRVRARFEAGTVEPSATEWEVNAGPPVFLGNDIAVLPVAAPEDMNARPVFVPAYGRVRAGLAYPSAVAVGFPSAQARENLKRADGSAASYRDSKQAIGNLTPLSQLKSGNWEFSVSNPPPGSTQPDKSSWAGMSGASVWVAERLVGVITEDVHPKGANTLTVSPLAGLWELPPSLAAGSLEEFFECSDPAAWVDVSVADSLQSVLSDHYRQVLDIAPEGGAKDRQQELSRMTAFCRDEVTEGYWWWRARPWAGKTALMASFAAEAPPDLRVASFFINSQRESRRDSRAFSEAILPQLDALAGNVRPTPVTPGAEDQTLNRCLDAAAKACREQGTHLVLVVDALDEDNWTDIGGIRPSIASLLPTRTPYGLRVLVSSRSNPELPVDVPANHPLKAETVRHELLPSPHAAEVKERATQETKKILGSEGIENEALILIALAGALSPKEIADITRGRSFKVEDVLSHCRVLAGEDRHFIEDTPERVYALSHTTLPELIKDLLGEDEVRVYQGRINEWARKYSRDGWPDATPAFFLTGAYPKFLASAGELKLLVEWALDRQLQTRLWQLTGSSLQSLEDIRLAQDQNIKRREIDLAAALRLCMMRNEIEAATTNLPARIPVLYARMGQHRRAFILAMSIRDSSSREQSLTEMSQVQADTGHLHQAKSTASAITNPRARSVALVRIARAWAGAGQDPIPALEDALDAARSINDPMWRSKVQQDIARALADAGQDPAPVFEEVLDAARKIDDYEDDAFDPGRRPKALLEIARVMTETGQDATAVFQEAVDTARNDDPARRPQALLGIARVLADIGQDAAPVLPDVLNAARNIDDPGWRSLVLLNIARVLARLGQDAALVLQDALDAARHELVPEQRSKVLLDIARVLASVGQDAAAVLQEALDVAREVDEWRRSDVLLDVVQALADTGQDSAPALRIALATARSITDPGRRSKALLDIAQALANAGQDAATVFQEALDAACNIDDPGWRLKVLLDIARALADAGQGPALALQNALDVAREVDEWRRSDVLLDVVQALADTGQDSAPALRIALATARSITDPGRRSKVLLDIAQALANAGQDAATVFQEALDAACNIDDPGWRLKVLLDIARALADAGQGPALALQNALDAAREVDERRRSDVLLDIAQALADTGQDPAPTLQDALTAASTLSPRLDSGALENLAQGLRESNRITQALGSAYSIPDPKRRSMVLLDIAKAMVHTGQDATFLFQEALDAVRSIDDPGQRPNVLLDIARAMADTGQDVTSVFQEALDTGRNYYASTDDAPIGVKSHPGLRVWASSCRISRSRVTLSHGW
ncbi:hypothetical protein NicSoilB11_01010 [Arthrobacter sp. NicSoilB11]|nr:hypothetical protein NicSoilB11_01010 [Arthrobacter sp. NicSoilB11]